MRNAAKASSSEYLMGTLRSVAPSLGIELIVAGLAAPGDIEPAFATAAREGAARQGSIRDARSAHAREPSPHGRPRRASPSPGARK